MIATSPLEDTIKQYLGLQPLLGGKPVRGANVDVAVSMCGAEEIPRLFANLEDLLLMLAQSGVGELRRRWIVNPRNQLKPTEIHIMKLFAYRLLGNPNIWGRGNTSFTQLIMKAFGLKSHRPIGYHLKSPHFTMTPVHAISSPTRHITNNAQYENATTGQVTQRPGLLSSAKKIAAKVGLALSNLRRTTEKKHSDNNNSLQSEQSESNPDRSSTNESDSNEFVTRRLNFSILGSATNSMQASVQPDQEETHQSTDTDDFLPFLDDEPQLSRVTFDSDVHVFPQYIQDPDEEDFYQHNTNGNGFQPLLDNKGPQGSATENDMSLTLTMPSPMDRVCNSFDEGSSTRVKQQHRPVTRSFSQTTKRRAPHDLPPAADEELIDDDSDEWREDEDDFRGQPRKRHNSNPTPAKDSPRSSEANRDKNGPKRTLPQGNFPTSLQSETRQTNRVEPQHFTFGDAETNSADATARASRNLMDTVVHLVIHGSCRVKRVCKAMLVGSCNATTVNNILQHHGWAAKRKAQVIQHKVFLNNRMRRQRQKENKPVREEDLIPEESKLKFSSPFSDSRIRRNHIQNLQKLKRGEDIMEPPKTTRISWDQTDKLAEYIGRHCHQRPGTLKRAIIDSQRLPLLTFYIRYG